MDVKLNTKAKMIKVEVAPFDEEFQPCDRMAEIMKEEVPFDVPSQRIVKNDIESNHDETTIAIDPLSIRKVEMKDSLHHRNKLKNLDIGGSTKMPHQIQIKCEKESLILNDPPIVGVEIDAPLRRTETENTESCPGETNFALDPLSILKIEMRESLHDANQIGNLYIGDIKSEKMVDVKPPTRIDSNACKVEAFVDEVQGSSTNIEGVLYQCPECKKVFLTKQSLAKHCLTHTKKKLHACPQCDKRFSLRRSLRDHILLHTGEKPHVCQHCGNRFTQKSNLRTHHLIHTGDKLHECQHCGKWFTLRSSLLRHLRMHAGLKPHQCHLCDKRFSKNNHLKTHLLTHTGEKPHKCEQCGKTFALKHHLKGHVLSHFRKSMNAAIKADRDRDETKQRTSPKLHVQTAAGPLKFVPSELQ